MTRLRPVSNIYSLRYIVCDQSGDRLSKNDKSCHICSRNKGGFSRTMENMGYVYLKLRLDKPQYNAYNSKYNDNGP